MRNDHRANDHAEPAKKGELLAEVARALPCSAAERALTLVLFDDDIARREVLSIDALPQSPDGRTARGLGRVAAALESSEASWLGAVLERPGDGRATPDDWAWWGALRAGFTNASPSVDAVVIASAAGVHAFAESPVAASDET